MTYILPKAELADLRQAHAELRDKRGADRVKAVILLGSGWSVAKVAEALLIDANTVRTYFRRYQQGGLEELLQMHWVGRTSFLALEQESELDEYLQGHLHLTAKSVANYIQERWKVRYSVRGVTALLYRLDYVYKKPKLIPGKADAKAPEAFLESYEKLKENKADDDIVLFMDGVRPQPNPVLACGWIKRGARRLRLRAIRGGDV
ncbi:MAG: winged helix-turn-helix domain-containing protein [Methylococcales bacterium]